MGRRKREPSLILMGGSLREEPWPFPHGWGSSRGRGFALPPHCTRWDNTRCNTAPPQRPYGAARDNREERITSVPSAALPSQSIRLIRALGCERKGLNDAAILPRNPLLNVPRTSAIGS
jgi:hypothetical protein